MHFCIMSWWMRLSKPLTDILLHYDDINATFRYIMYHPDLAIAFPYVFQEYLPDCLSPFAKSSALGVHRPFLA